LRTVIFLSAVYIRRTEAPQIYLQQKVTFSFFAPNFVFEEIKNHLSEISDKSGKTKREISNILQRITSNVIFYTVDDVPKKYTQKAIEIVRDIDIFDAPFIALHLYKKHKIWTGDRILINGLKKKGYDICITTTQLKKMLYKK